MSMSTSATIAPRRQCPGESEEDTHIPAHQLHQVRRIVRSEPTNKYTPSGPTSNKKKIRVRPTSYTPKPNSSFPFPPMMHDPSAQSSSKYAVCCIMWRAYLVKPRLVILLQRTLPRRIIIVRRTIDRIRMCEGTVHEPLLHESLETVALDFRVPHVAVELSMANAAHREFQVA